MCARSIKTADSSLQTQRKIQKPHLASLLERKERSFLLFSLKTKQWQITELKAKKVSTTKLNTI